MLKKLLVISLAVLSGAVLLTGCGGGGGSAAPGGTGADTVTLSVTSGQTTTTTTYTATASAGAPAGSDPETSGEAAGTFLIVSMNGGYQGTDLLGSPIWNIKFKIMIAGNTTGTYPVEAGNVTYLSRNDNASYVSPTNSPGTVTFMRIDGIGGRMQGTFENVSAYTYDLRNVVLSGSFDVTRVQ